MDNFWFKTWTGTDASKQMYKFKYICINITALAHDHRILGFVMDPEGVTDLTDFKGERWNKNFSLEIYLDQRPFQASR